ncbi:MAG: TlpA family protein disulfide reductase [Janthinobacterium lividum]
MRSTSRLLLAFFLAAGGVAAHGQDNASPFIAHFQGKVPPPIAASDRSNQPVDLKAFRGKVVIVNLWATWCSPCRVELPSLDRLVAANHGTVVVLAVSNDRGGWPAIDRFWGTSYPHLSPVLATDSELPTRLGALALPFTLVLDRQGREVIRVPRAVDWTSAEAQALIKRALAVR